MLENKDLNHKGKTFPLCCTPFALTVLYISQQSNKLTDKALVSHRLTSSAAGFLLKCSITSPLFNVITFFSLSSAFLCKVIKPFTLLYGLWNKDLWMQGILCCSTLLHCCVVCVIILKLIAESYSNQCSRLLKNDWDFTLLLFVTGLKLSNFVFTKDRHNPND